MAVAAGVYAPSEINDMIREFQLIVEEAFNAAVNEPKITSREALVHSNSSPLARTASQTTSSVAIRTAGEAVASTAQDDNRPEVMRKQMTRVYDEILGTQKDAVYIGEDVEHGG